MKAAVVVERGRVEEELIKAKNQARLEEVSVAGQLKGTGCLGLHDMLL